MGATATGRPSRRRERDSPGRVRRLLRRSGTRPGGLWLRPARFGL